MVGFLRLMDSWLNCLQTTLSPRITVFFHGEFSLASRKGNKHIPLTKSIVFFFFGTECVVLAFLMTPGGFTSLWVHRRFFTDLRWSSFDGFKRDEPWFTQRFLMEFPYEVSNMQKGWNHLNKQIWRAIEKTKHLIHQKTLLRSWFCLFASRFLGVFSIQQSPHWKPNISAENWWLEDDSFPLSMDVSENSGTSKSSILIGFSIINHPFLGYPHPYGPF